MKFVNIDFSASRPEVLSMIANNEIVNQRVRIDNSRGKPVITVNEKGKNRIKISCKLVGGPTKDNGFVQGTTLSGTLIEKNGVTKLRGVITTEPIYHFFFLVMIALFIVQCFRLRGISFLPPTLAVFDVFMFKNEFKKQGYIKRYLYRVARRLSQCANNETEY